jgi:hypothetical protein
MDDFVRAGILAALLADLTVPFGAKPVDPGLHSRQQLFRRTGGNPSPLQLPDFTALPRHLAAHVLDFISEVIESWHVSP